MRKSWILLLALLLGLSGCKTGQMFRVDTIVDIPLKPTESAEAVTDAATEPVAEPTVIPQFPGKGGTVSANQDDASGESTEPVATEPPETEAPTNPPVDTQAIYDISDYVPGSLEYEILAAVNTRRAAEGLGVLGLDNTLCGAASVRAYEITVSWSHTRPDGRDGLSVLGDYGCETSAAAEILYYTYGAGNGERIVGTWMNAESNRQQVMDDAFTAVGIGTYRTADGLICVAAIFVT